MPTIDDNTFQELQSYANKSDSGEKVRLKLQGHTLTTCKAITPRDKLYLFLARFGIGPMSLAKIVSHINTLQAAPGQEEVLNKIKSSLAGKVQRYNEKKFRWHVPQAEVVKLTHTVASKTISNVKLDVPPVVPIGKGIVNPGNSCYLNSVVQGLRAVPLGSMQQRFAILGSGNTFERLAREEFTYENLTHAHAILKANRAEFEELYKDSKHLTFIPHQVFEGKTNEEITTQEKLQAIEAVLERGFVTDEEAADLRLFFTEMKEIVGRIREARERIRTLHETLKSETVKNIDDLRIFLITECGFNGGLYSQEDAADACLAILQAAAIKPFSTADGVDTILRLPLKEGAGSLNELLQDVVVEHPAPVVLPIQLDRYPEGGREKRQDPITPTTEVVVNVFGSEPVTYKLRSIVVHAGSTPQSGHYYTYVPQPDGSWVEFNDDNVYPHPKPQSQQDNAAKNGLLYFYEKVS